MIISDATIWSIWSVTLESSIPLLEASFTRLDVSFTEQATVAMIVNYNHNIFVL